MDKTAKRLFVPADPILRPEKDATPLGGLESGVHRLKGIVVQRLFFPGSGRRRKIVLGVNQYETALKSKSNRDLAILSGKLRLDLHCHGFRFESICHTFALIREMSNRTLGMRHFDCQVLGGWALLNGMVAEMETGEGKTLAATLAAGTAALAGVPVHVITVNDYLTARDAEWMGRLYQALGLTVGCVVHGLDPEAKKKAYQCDIAYCTNKEVAFDYLRDRIAIGKRRGALGLQAEYLYPRNSRGRQLLLRGLHFAIVDEADSILIDEARTPLLISKKVEGKKEEDFLKQALSLCEHLEEGNDYTLDKRARSIELTARGKANLKVLTASLGPLWTGPVRREEIVQKALVALRLFHKDEHYLVKDGQVQIVDAFTGRVMPDRSWEKGLHQLIETKENCEITRPMETQARITYQRFFRRYLHLSGMTGTAREVKGELWSVYGLPVARIPAHRPMKRTRYPDRFFESQEAKWRAIVSRIRAIHGQGRPVLVGSRSVAASEHASRLLHQAGLKHRVLNARQDSHEARIVARAGEAGSITIATNMAGRGTDIELSQGVAKKYGLHVILTERHEAARIDRQLFGRCGRQGDPGSFEAMLSLEDTLVKDGKRGLFERIALRFLQPRSIGWKIACRLSFTRAQKRMERLHARMRRNLYKEDQRRGDMLSFSGRGE